MGLQNISPSFNSLHFTLRPEYKRLAEFLRQVMEIYVLILSLQPRVCHQMRILAINQLNAQNLVL